MDISFGGSKMEIGTKVIMNSDGQKGIVSDLWNPHLLNPNIFSANAPTGYEIILEGGHTRVCTEDDFTISK